MRSRIEMIGKRFGRLCVVAISTFKKYDNKETVWECLCECGRTCHIPGWFLRNNVRKSCGCMWRPNDSCVSAYKSKLEFNSKWQGQCQVWKGPINKNGFGKMVLSNRTFILVHNLSWKIHIGKIPKNFEVAHLCQNPLCVRSDHLYLIAHKEC